MPKKEVSCTVELTGKHIIGLNILHKVSALSSSNMQSKSMHQKLMSTRKNDNNGFEQKKEHEKGLSWIQKFMLYLFVGIS